MGVNVWGRLKDVCTKRTWPWSSSTSAIRDGNGAVIFASTKEVLRFAYRPNLSVRDVCTEAALKVNISPVALDFFTLVSEDGGRFLNPNKVLSEVECSQVYLFKLCIKACHGLELRDFDRQAFEYYFHQCRQDFLSGEIGEFNSANQKDLAEVIIYEIIYQARKQGVPSKDVIDNPVRYRIKKLFHRGIFTDYPPEETKAFLKVYVTEYEIYKDDQIKSHYISTLERAEDFFVHTLSFEKIYFIEHEQMGSQRRFDVLISAEFGIKKRRKDINNSVHLPEVIVEKFSEVEALEFDHMRNLVTIFRTNFRPETLTASSTQEAYSLITLIEGYYRLMVNQYKKLLRGPKSTLSGVLQCHGPISRVKAENFLSKECREDGFFLLRRTRRHGHSNHVLSVYVGGKVMHYVITKDTDVSPAMFHLESDPKKGFSDLSGLIEHYRLSADGLHVCLKQILRPKTEGFAALLDRQVLTPAIPEVHLVDVTNQIDDLIFEENSLSPWGEFGEVKKGSWSCATAEELVLIVSRALMKPIGRDTIRNFKEAMGTFLELHNPYLTQFYGITQTEKALIFVFEFAAEGPLDRYIANESKKEGGITKGRVVSYAAQIAEGMMFLHSKNCVHGRLRAHNVLVAYEECVKISDYGLLHLVKNGQSFFHTSNRGYGYCWYSPESLHVGAFTMESDVWSFGVTLWEMFAMKKPFHCSFPDHVLTDNQVMSRYLKGQYLNPDRPNCPANVGNLIRRCCAPEPKDRMSFRELVTELRSPDLVPDDQAQSILDQADFKQLEDWETPPRQNAIELEPILTNSEVSNGDYSCLPADEDHEVSPNDDHSHKLPGISLIASMSLFGNTSSRKRSLSKTFSHPGLVHTYDEPEGAPSSREPLHLLAPRKPSVTRVCSCPPTIHAASEESLRTEPTERQQEIRYVPMISAAKKTNVKLPCPNSEVKPPFFSFPSQLLVFETGVDDPATVSSEELGDSDNSTDDDSSTGEDGGAEVMAMRSLGQHTSIQQSSVCSSAPVEMLPVSFDVDVDDHDEERSEQLPECGSSPYINLDTATSTSSDSRSSQSSRRTEEQPEKLRAGSYVTLSPSTQVSMPQDQAKGSNIPQCPSTVGDSPVPAASLQSPSATSCSAPEPCSPNAEQQTPRNTSHNKDEGLVNASGKSADEFLASFSIDSLEKGIGSVSLTELFSGIDDGSFEEGSSPLITDLQEESDVDDTDFRGNAELSLGQFSLPISSVGFELSKISEQPSFVPDDEHAHCNTQTRTDVELGSINMSMGINSNQELDEHIEEDESTLPEEESQGYHFVSNTSTDVTPSVPEEQRSFPPELPSDTGCMDDESDQENQDDDDDDDETSDTELASLCGLVWHSPGKIDVLKQSQFLVFDQGQENLEMREFSLNNLSKDSLKSTEFPVFNDEHFFSSLCSNQLEEACSEDGYSLDGNQESEDVIQGNMSGNPTVNNMGDIKEITEPAAGTSHYIDKEDRITRNMDGDSPSESLNEQPCQDASELGEQEEPAALSEGIWPSSEAGKRECIRRTSTIGSCSSSGDDPSTLDMSKIPAQLQIPYEHLQIQGFLGRGQFGEVRKADIVSTDYLTKPKKEEVAVKVLKDTASAKDSSDFIKEVQTMIELESKQRCLYIIKLRGVSKDPSGKLMLVTELAPLGALDKYLPKNTEILRTPQLLDFCMQICKGMRYLENQSLLHKDLAARNILVMREDLVKISDFGLSRLQDYYKLQDSSKVPIKWYALESLLKQRFTTKSDVWSFGVTMWEIFSYGQHKPYSEIESQELPRFLEDGKRLSCPQQCPPKVYDVMYNCWLKDATKRPSFFLLETTYLETLQEEYNSS